MVRPHAWTALLVSTLLLPGAASWWSGGRARVHEAPGPSLADEVDGLLRIPSVPGREGDAAAYIRGRLGQLGATTDSLGDIVVRVGRGSPRLLLACALDEPGLVVSGIDDDGYLRVRAVGAPRASLWAQYREGQKVVVGQGAAAVAGAVGVRSVHLHGRVPGESPFELSRAYVDVGAESAADVARLGVRLLDPVALVRRVVRLPKGRLAAPSSRTKASCMALADAARRVAVDGSHGTTVFAWTVQGLHGGRGLLRVRQAEGPFDRVVVLDGDFQAATKPGSGPVGAGSVDAARLGVQMVGHRPVPGGGGPSAATGFLGVPARYAGTPVETVAMADVDALADALVAVTGARGRSRPAAPPLPEPPALSLEVSGARAPSAARPPEGGAGAPHADAAALLSTLVARYGVSGDEHRVREAVRALLPAWARPTVDSAGNLRVDFGAGAAHDVFVAHMDEVGFRIDSIRPDGRLVLSRRGGLYPSLWEAQAALVHTADRDVPAVFEPRPDWQRAAEREPAGPLVAWVGASSPDAVRALGVRVGQSVTMPKRMLRIGAHRVVARGFDDRAGDAALLLAARRLDPTTVRHRVTFAWVVEEEIGLNGSTALASDEGMQDVGRAYAVDTFVSSDAPLESHQYAFAPLGSGPVIRVMDSATLTPRRVLDETLAVAGDHHIPVQYGMTSGGTDATPFVRFGAAPVPISWPGRYSHSPVEVADLRDIEGLAALIQALVAQTR